MGTRTDLLSLDAVELRDRIAAGALRAVELVEACIARIDALEPQVGAWAWFDADFARHQARELDKARSTGRPIGPLHGLPVGLKDIVAIAMNDAVLVAHKSEAQRVKEAVSALKARGASQAVQLPRDYRPWGWYESLVIGGRFQVKRIVVNPGAALSLQSHHHRSEHWIVVEGTARVTVNDDVQLLSENQSVYIPLGDVHRMENPGKLPMVLIEVQTGSYLGEDDIIRYEDVYARS